MGIKLKLVLVVVGSTLMVGLADGQEEKIRRSDLPAAVEKTVQDQIHGATVRGFSKEIEKGETYYEVQLMVDGHSKDVQMDKSGAIVEVEEQVALDTLPPDVKSALERKAADGQLTKVESITKHDKLMAYEAQVVTEGKHSEVQVGPGGESLDHEE